MRMDGFLLFSRGREVLMLIDVAKNDYWKG